MISKHIAFVLLILTSVGMKAQTIHHYNVWSKFSITQPIDKQIKTEVDLQHRSQNNYFTDNTPFDESLMNSIRVTVMYQLNNKIGFSISPFSYFTSNAIIQKQSDINKATNHEIRFAANIELQEQLGSHLYLINKTGIEYRDFEHTNNTIRIRNKIGMRCDINDKISATLYEEPLFNIIGSTKNHFYDHNRIALLGSYKPNKHWRAETGFIYINRLPSNNDRTLNEENIVLNLYYTLNSLNKHKS